MKLSSLLYSGEYRSNRDAGSVEISRIVSDTEEIVPGCLFVCIRGANFDSHLHLPFIAASGAAAAIVEVGSSFERIPSFPIFEVRNSREALAYAWSRFCGSPERRLTMVGITGTNGKTTTSYLIRSLLNSAGFRCGLIGTVAFLSDRDTPDSISGSKSGTARTMTTPDPEVLYPLLREMVDEGLTHVVMEVSSHALALRKTAPISFDVALFTNLSPEHLDFHRTMEDYIAAKQRLFLSAKTAILNSDSPYAGRMTDGTSCRAIFCSTEHEATVRANDIKLAGIKGVSYIYRTDSCAFPVFVPIPGLFSVYNSLLAVACAIELGVPPSTAKHAISAVSGICGRMERILTDGEPFSVFLDFAHTEAALRSLLSTVRSFREKTQRIVLLFGCGGDRDRSKRAPMGRVAQELADYTIVTSDNSRGEDPRQIIKEILSGMPDASRRKVIVNRERAIQYAILTARPGDILLLVGKGHETYEISGGVMRAFDERKIILAALEKRRSGHTMTGELHESRA